MKFIFISWLWNAGMHTRFIQPSLAKFVYGSIAWKLVLEVAWLCEWGWFPCVTCARRVIWIIQLRWNYMCEVCKKDDVTIYLKLNYKCNMMCIKRDFMCEWGETMWVACARRGSWLCTWGWIILVTCVWRANWIMYLRLDYMCEMCKKSEVII